MNKFLQPNPVILAHRGDSENFPENTMPAFISAYKMGVDVIETDVHLTKDDRLIIWHDDNLKRITGEDVSVDSCTFDYLMGLDAGLLFTKDGGKTYPFTNSGVSMVCLKNLLTALPEARFNIDMKSNNPRIAEKLVKILEETASFDRVCIASFHSPILRYFRTLAPEVLTSFTLVEVAKYAILAKLGLSFLVKNSDFNGRVFQMPEKEKGIKLLTKPFIRMCKRKGVKIHIWTINEQSEMERLLKLGVDGLFTDNPRLLQLLLES